MESENKVKNFCTIVSRKYILKGLALHHSLKKYILNFHLWIYCVDDAVYALINNMMLMNVTVISVKDVEDKTLRKAKKERDKREYCRTLKPSCILHTFEIEHSLEYIIFVDADLFFFSGSDELINEWGEHSIYFCSQRSSEETKLKTGRFNSGLIGFKNDENALECLKWWQEKCSEWCNHKIETDDEQWSDQKYLDQCPKLFEGIKISEHAGINIGPWNVGNYKLKSKQDGLYCNNQKLIAYHYSGFHIFNEAEFNLCAWRHINKRIKKIIYLPYVKTIYKMIKGVKATDSKFLLGFSYRFSTDRLLNYYKYKSKK